MNVRHKRQRKQTGKTRCKGFMPFKRSVGEGNVQGGKKGEINKMKRIRVLSDAKNVDVKIFKNSALKMFYR